MVTSGYMPLCIIYRDTGVLDESIHFLEGRLVNPEDDSYYDLPAQSEEKSSLYEHCKRSILHGLRLAITGSL